LNKKYIYVIIGCTLLVLAASLTKSWIYSTTAGGVDLRCRIVSARLPAAGHSPYFYHWQPSDGERLLDPGNNPTRKVNGNVVTPAVLTLLYPLAALPYAAVRIMWSVLLYCFLLGCFFLVYPDVFKKDRPFKAAPWVILCLFACSTLWFYNIERGQIYPFYLFLFALIYRLSQSQGRYGRFVVGCLGGFCVFLRPLLGVLFIPFAVAKDTRWLGGFATGIVIGALVFVLPKPVEWRDYFSAMDEYGKEMLGYSSYRPEAVVKEMPAGIEGMTNLKNSAFFNTGGLTTVQFYSRGRGILLSSKILIACYGLAAILLAWLYVRRGNGVMDNDRVFLFGFLLYITAELFLVGYRGSYNLIQWFFPVLLVSKYWPTWKNTLLLSVAAILILNGWLPAIPHLFELAEVLLLAALAWVCFSNKWR